MKKYYLNNVTEKAITISLTAKRTVKPLTSLSLNDKDVKLYKDLKRKRAGKPSLLDGLVLSTIKLENDANFINAKATKTTKPAKSANKNENPDNNKKEAEEKAKKELEEKAKKEAEEKAKLEAIAKEKEEIRKALIEENAKDGKNFEESDLEKLVEEAYAKAHKNDK